jgi:hypothetical protein
MARQSEMFERPPRKTRGQLMHVCDAGAGEDKPVVQFECRKCHFQSDWYQFDTVTEAKRGIPCPRCNEVKSADQATSSPPTTTD